MPKPRRLTRGRVRIHQQPRQDPMDAALNNVQLIHGLLGEIQRSFAAQGQPPDRRVPTPVEVSATPPGKECHHENP